MRARARLLGGVLCLATAVPVLAGFSGTDLFLPNVGRQAGVFPSNWYTTVWINNPGAAAATARVYLLVRGTVNLSPPWVDVLVPPGDTEKLDNVVESLFHQQVFGALRVTCDTQKLVVTSRVYSKGAGAGEKDSAGQDFAGVPAAFAIGVGEKSQVLGVYQTQPSADSDYRFNFGMVETTGHTANVRVTAYDENNASQGSTDVTVRAYSQGQWAFKDRFPSVSTDNVRLEVQVISGTGEVIAYGSGITNGSQDPTTFEMQYADTLLGGIAAIQHDATLTGDGSAATPLGVADAGVTAQKIAPSATAGQVLATVASGSPAPGGVAAAAAGSSVAWQSLSALSLGLAAKGVTFGGASGGLAQDATAFVWDAVHHRLGLGTATPQDQLELTGRLRLPATTATAGVLLLGGQPFLHAFGSSNTFIGASAGNFTMTGNTNTAVGSSSLHADTTGSNNTASGQQSLYSNTEGSDNTASGFSSLYYNTTGIRNTAVGSGSLSGNTTGSYNAANGFMSLRSNTTGSQNTATGDSSLWHNTTGSNNTAGGASSLYSNTSGTNNTASGFFSLYANTTGASNTASGDASLYNNTTGGSNTATGSHSLFSNTTGANNTATGNSSLYSNTTGSANTASGDSALTSNTTGRFNTASGDSSLRFATTGESNTAYGSQSLYSTTTAVGNTASGAQSLYSNTTGYDNTASGIVSLWSNTTGGENTASGDQALTSNTTGNDNTAIGAFALYANTTGNANSAIGTSAGDSNLSGSNNTFLGTSADALAGGLTNATAVGHGAKVDAANHVRIGDASVTQIGGQVAWSNLSDARHKSDVRDLDLGRDFVMALRPVSFTVNGGDGRTDMGFLAQDVEALLGDGYNVLGVGADPDRTLSLRYTDLIAPLVKAAQEQQAQIAAQARTIEAQQAALAGLLARVAALEKAAK